MWRPVGHLASAADAAGPREPPPSTRRHVGRCQHGGAGTVRHAGSLDAPRIRADRGRSRRVPSDGRSPPRRLRLRRRRRRGGWHSGPRAGRSASSLGGPARCPAPRTRRLRGRPPAPLRRVVRSGRAVGRAHLDARPGRSRKPAGPLRRDRIHLEVATVRRYAGCDPRASRGDTSVSVQSALRTVVAIIAVTLIGACAGADSTASRTTASAAAVASVATSVESASGSAIPPDFPVGSWTTTITEADLRAAGVTAAGLINENTGVFTTVFASDGIWTTTQVTSHPVRWPVFRGTFRVTGPGRFEQRTEFPADYAGDIVVFTWTRQGDDLRLGVPDPSDPILSIT